ncbi:tRNA pseudouridine(38-40) synthase TruA [Candidatus Erwinia haradaeae]|uniref:tRNA pseudouridine synthase A n=1 Tax=Candidatus Erwinia haradaeae TaxID=1922217 RepID=A0A803FVC8_9GAMM|nr:tRNA pseudouridine(38-40) synthase TruA [Candidatus Erwinia haradaeae]VFP88862.1 tRNA pseudouridine synthase A [Candidatus Erwinia haradaeae]
MKTFITLAFGIEYDGSCYCGWQRQNAVPTVQEAVERAIEKIAAHKIRVICAGRTDTGVHAIGQVIHFKTFSQRTDMVWLRGVNGCLPADIVVRWVKRVPDLFHARFSALSRCYRYMVNNHNLHRSAIFRKKMAYIYQFLDVEKMQRASHCLLGEHNFTSFRAGQCQSRFPIRNIMQLNITRDDRYVIIDIQANSFVHHMVRNIVGSLIEVGSGRKPESWIADLLLAKNRTLAAATASAHGLYLVSVEYPSNYKIPSPLFNSLALQSKKTLFLEKYFH